MAKGSSKGGGGYCDPPKHSQFAKGVSGNPGGRPKGSRNFTTEFEAEMKVKRTSKSGKTVGTKRAIAMAITHKALSGDIRAIERVMAIAREIDAAAQDRQVHKALSANDQLILDQFLGIANPADADDGAEDWTDLPMDLGGGDSEADDQREEEE